MNIPEENLNFTFNTNRKTPILNISAHPRWKWSCKRQERLL